MARRRETQATEPLDIPIMAGTLGPIMARTLGPRMLQIMLPQVAGWNVHWGEEPFMNRPERLVDLHQWLAERCLEAGREPLASAR